MLVLKRKPGESIVIGEDIEIRVLRVEGDNVRIGIVAPQNVLVLRAELLEEIRTETAASVKPNLAAIQSLSKVLQAKPQATKPPAVPVGKDNPPA